jgi:tetratricopeptide (TPR) repeat protein/TolB-like protein
MADAGTPRLTTTGQLPAGALVGAGYRILRELGAGGSAHVHLAEEIAGGRMVAVKVLKPEIAASLGRQRFLREIRILSALQHPGILPILDAGEVDTLPYYVSPYIAGGTLRDLLRRDHFLPTQDAYALVTQLAEALDYAHAQGIVHRDLKPENILLGADGPLLADFGIARALDVAAGETLTDSGLIVGTPIYMSPEQGSGGSKVGGAADQYALAVVAYEMLAGGVPFDGPTPHAVLARKSRDPVPPLRTVRGTLPPGIEQVMQRALAVVPADRYPTVRAFAADLALPPPPPAIPAGLRQRASRERVVVLAGMGMLTLAIAFAAWRAAAPPPPDTPTGLPRVVVSEFANLTGDAAFDQLGIAAIDWLTETMQQTGVVSSVPTETALRASRAAARDSNGRDPVQRIAEAAASDFVVTGRVYRQGDSVRYMVQVTQASTNQLIGAVGPVTAPRAEPVAGLSEVATRLVALLAASRDQRLTDVSERTGTPPKYEAYRRYTEGLDRYLASDFTGALAHFREATAADTGFAPPRIYASIALSNLGRYVEAEALLDSLQRQRERLSPYNRAWLDYRTAFASGRRLAGLTALRALDSLAPGTKTSYNHALEAMENGFVHEAVAVLTSVRPDVGPLKGWIPYYEVLGAAHHLLGDFDAESRVGRMAQTVYPTRLYALLPTVRAAAALGNRSALDAVLSAARALPTDPYGTTAALLHATAGDVSAARGRPTEAAARWREAIALATAGGPPTESSQQRMVVETAVAVGDVAAAAPSARALMAKPSPTTEDLAAIGAWHAASGDTLAARRTMARLAAGAPKTRFGTTPFAQAKIAAVLGADDEAERLLAKAFAEGKAFDLWMHNDPAFARLRMRASYRAWLVPRDGPAR